MKSEIEILRKLMCDELEAANAYDELKNYLSSDERKIINEITRDEQIHLEQLRMLMRKRIPDYNIIEDNAKKENEEAIKYKE